MQVILTGGNRGIGAQMTSQMRARGDTVLATSRDGSTGAVLDVTNSEQIKALRQVMNQRLIFWCATRAFTSTKVMRSKTGTKPKFGPKHLL